MACPTARMYFPSALLCTYMVLPTVQNLRLLSLLLN